MYHGLLVAFLVGIVILTVTAIISSIHRLFMRLGLDDEPSTMLAMVVLLMILIVTIGGINSYQSCGSPWLCP